MPLQEGIYWDSGATPGPCFAIMFLRVTQGATVAEIAPALDRLWKVHDDLRRGRIADLPGIDLPASGLTILWGYGPKAFKIPGANHGLPSELAEQNQFWPPQRSEISPILGGASINFAPGLDRNPATEEIMVQAIGDTSLAVNRVIVETWKLLKKTLSATTSQPLLEMTASFTGFNREDGRSWIDFHDGVSNLRSGTPRLHAIAVKRQGLPENRWTEGGTYLCFVRLAVDLAAWQKLSQTQQELVVGRSKLTGCPLVSVDAAGNPSTMNGCPFSGTSAPTDPANAPFREPPLVTDDMRFSHVQRANHDHDDRFETPDSHRFFRQGYEFVEPPLAGSDLVLGLNFVSFQDTPTRVLFTLTMPDWLGDSNFGGSTTAPQPGMASLLKAQAAGIFFCPEAPEAGEFPGSSIFRQPQLVAAAAPRRRRAKVANKRSRKARA
ncbi:hypothetical protein [Bradyrhizobium sp.]|uniref:Dyp-type peroxidase n=1 Tax=Bradyrhizobium sp. TaxID=376 RepID=UPI002E072766|nr:hypothetical protein [Bradyrhizobium sp.]